MARRSLFGTANGIGVGWVLLTGEMVANAYDIPLGAGVAASRVIRDGLGVPIGGMLC